MGAMRPCPEVACEEGPKHDFHFPLGSTGQDLRLSAGDYELYIVTDGDKVMGRLQLSKLEGKTNLMVKKPTAATVEVPVERLVLEPGRNVYSAGATHRTFSKSLLFTSLWVETSRAASRRSGSCLWQGVPPLPQETSYMPGCSAFGAEEVSGQRFNYPPGGGAGFIETNLFALNRGRWSYGTYFASPDSVDILLALNTWLPLSE